MVQTGFYLGRNDWWIMASIGIDGRDDLREVYEALLSIGAPDNKAQEICMTLSQPNTGYTYTDYDCHYTLMFISKATSYAQMYDTLTHEQKHVVEHISNYYGVDPKSEEAAYLAGEIGRLLFPAAAYVLCPRCSRML